LYSGISAGADVIVIPKYPLTVEEIAEVVENRRRKGRKFSLLVVAEGGEKAYGTYYGKLSVVGRLKMVSLEEFLRAKIFFG